MPAGIKLLPSGTEKGTHFMTLSPIIFLGAFLPPVF